MKNNELIKQQGEYIHTLERKIDYLELENTEIRIEKNKLTTELEKTKNSLVVILEENNAPF